MLWGSRATSHPRVFEGVAAGGSKDDQVLFVEGEELPRIVSHMVLDTRDAKVWLLKWFHHGAGSKEMFPLIGPEGSRKAIARLGIQIGTRWTVQQKNSLNYKGHECFITLSKQHRQGNWASSLSVQTPSRPRTFSKALQRFFGCTNVAALQHGADVVRLLALRTVETTKDEELE